MIKWFIKQHEFFLCLFLGFTFFGSGMAKLYFEHAYLGWIGPVWLEDRLTPHGLGLYARFIGYSQVIIGYLLLTYRFRIPGAIMAVPLIGNILMVTISLYWRGTPFVVGVLLLMNLYILYRNRAVLKPLIGLGGSPSKLMSSKNSMIWLSGLMLNLVSISLSIHSIQLAWGMSFVGLFFSFLANHKEKRLLQDSSE